MHNLLAGNTHTQAHSSFGIKKRSSHCSFSNKMSTNWRILKKQNKTEKYIWIFALQDKTKKRTATRPSPCPSPSWETRLSPWLPLSSNSWWQCRSYWPRVVVEMKHSVGNWSTTPTLKRASYCRSTSWYPHKRLSDSRLQAVRPVPWTDLVSSLQEMDLFITLDDNFIPFTLYTEPVLFADWFVLFNSMTNVQWFMFSLLGCN